MVAFVLIALVVGTAATIFDSSGPEHCKKLELDLERLRTENLTASRENERLERRVEALRSDPRIIEQIAREEFGMIRTGEVVYRFPSE